MRLYKIQNLSTHRLLCRRYCFEVLRQCCRRSDVLRHHGPRYRRRILSSAHGCHGRGHTSNALWRLAPSLLFCSEILGRCGDRRHRRRSCSHARFLTVFHPRHGPGHMSSALWLSASPLSLSIRPSAFLPRSGRRCCGSFHRCCGGALSCPRGTQGLPTPTNSSRRCGLAPILSRGTPVPVAVKCAPAAFLPTTKRPHSQHHTTALPRRVGVGRRIISGWVGAEFRDPWPFAALVHHGLSRRCGRRHVRNFL